MIEERVIRDLIRVGTQALPHRYMGSCPDSTQLDSRDPLCAACKVLKLATSAMAEQPSRERAGI